ncbi:MAG: diaminopimelate epimerase [Breznakibacter sp.]
MKLKFHKYQGAGNDFVIVDNRDGHFDGDNEQLVRFLCDRRFGVGADGLMLLQNDPQTEFLMRYYNSDGGEASMCGNGGRCIAAFAVHQKLVKDPSSFVFNAVDGLHEASYGHGGIVSLKMQDVTHVARYGDAFFLNTGSPHHVVLVADTGEQDVAGVGRSIRYSPQYAPEGTNVNFVSIDSMDHITVRTYERGVEDETLACGTGVVASAICASLVNGSLQFWVNVKGGSLKVRFDRRGDQEFRNVYLVGPAQFVFSGAIDVTNH